MRRIQPLPLAIEDCRPCTRRALLQGLGATVAGSLVASACGGNGSATVDASKSSDSGGTCPTNDLCLDVTTSAYTALANVNGAVVVTAPSDQIMVVRTSATTVAALSAICTHQGCTVNYSSSNNDLQCPCHGAAFSLTGAVQNGPASTPLKTYSASVAGNIITIVGA